MHHTPATPVGDREGELTPVFGEAVGGCFIFYNLRQKGLIFSTYL
jgi:hypothetical protein